MRNPHSAEPGLFHGVSIVSVRVADAEIRYVTLACAISVCYARVYAKGSVHLPNARALADWQLGVYVSSQYNFIGGLKLISLDTPLPSDVCKFTATPHFSSQWKLQSSLPT